MLTSDGISGWVTPGNQVQISDLFLDGRNWGDVDTCKGGAGGYICPDTDSPTPCKDDILTPSGRRTAEFLVLEYSRRLNTGDTKCDTPIVPGVSERERERDKDKGLEWRMIQILFLYYHLLSINSIGYILNLNLYLPSIL